MVGRISGISDFADSKSINNSWVLDGLSIISVKPKLILLLISHSIKLNNSFELENWYSQFHC